MRIDRLLLRLAASLARIAVGLVIAIAVLSFFIPPLRLVVDVARAAVTSDRLDGMRDVMPLSERVLMNWYLGGIEKESGIDIRVLFAELDGRQTLEHYAAAAASDRGVGRRDGLRGVLVVYDRTSSAMRVEVGYGLEPYFTDAFTGRLIEDHAAAYFRADSVGLGLRLLARIMHERIRDEMMGGTFQVHALTASTSEHVSGGAGATAVASLDSAVFGGRGTATSASAAAAARFTAQATPADAHRLFLDWLLPDARVSEVPLLTGASQFHIATLPISGPYFDHIREVLWDEPFEIVERDDFAMLYFTATPLRSPMYFRRNRDGLWQVDIAEELCSTRETTGAYTWTLMDGCASTPVFRDLFVRVDRYVRVRGGDNRSLPAR